MGRSEFVERNDRSGTLRKRRAQILRDKKEDERVKGVIQETIVQSQRSNHILKTFLVVITALLCTVGALLRYSNPNIMKRFWKKPIPTFHLATRYPVNVILDRDLPRFFRHLSLATPDNVPAREAVRKVLRSRTQLRKRSDRIKTIVKAWDDSNVEQLLQQQICGADFVSAYNRGSQQMKENLLMWCILASRISEGYFKESVEMLNSPLFLTRKRGIVVRRQPSTGVSDGNASLSTSFYLHPRSYNSSAINWAPSKILGMLISDGDQDADMDGQEKIERMLYDLVVTEGHENEFLILDEICQTIRPERSIAFESGKNSGPCYFVMPEKYGGRFHEEEDE